MAPLILTGKLDPEILEDRVAVVTGAGGGIGFETARSLLWLGARVVIAEIDKRAGREAEQRLKGESGDVGHVLFVQTDVGSERSVARMARKAVRSFGKVDIVINNATVTPLGAIQDVPVTAWDASYQVNLRGPVLLARAFLLGMIDRGWGVFACVSSVGQAYMGAYEAMKAAQVHMASTLDAELQNTGVVAFAIGPGFVPTATALSAIPRLAEMMWQSEATLQALIAPHTLSIEAAGAGFAAAVAMADRYRGQEIASMQALMDAGIEVPNARAEADADADAGTSEGASEGRSEGAPVVAPETLDAIAAAARQVHTTLAEQAAGWQERNLFERQWMLRTFRSDARMPVEAWLDALDTLARAAAAHDTAALDGVGAPFEALARFFEHQVSLAQGYIKDPAEREKTLPVVRGWQDDAERLAALMKDL